MIHCATFLSLNDGTSPKWFVGSLKQQSGIHMDKAHFSQRRSVCVLQRLCTPAQTLGLLPYGSYPVNHSDCVFLSVWASVLVLAPDGGRPLDSHLTLLPQLQTGRKNGSIDSLRLVGSVSFLCEVCPTFFFFFNVMEVNGSELYFVVS